MEVDDAVAEPVVVEQLELHAHVVWQRPLAASDDDRREEQVDLVDQPGPDRLRGEHRPADRQVASRRRRELVSRLLGWCERLIVGVFGEHESERTTEDAVRSWGFEPAGRTMRPNRRKPGMEYRVLWIDR